MMPFYGGPFGEQNGLLIFAVVAAVAYAMMLGREPSWRRTVAKTLSVSLLAVLALVSGGPYLLIAALLLSALGDAFLAQKGERAFLGGLASFLAAHIAYVLLFAGRGGGLAMIASDWWRLALLPVIAVLAGAMLVRLRPAVDPSLRLPITIYIGAIAVMGCAALTLPMVVVIAGAFAFMASDAILGVETFLLTADSKHRQWTGITLWVLYFAAQVMITLGFLV